MSKNGGLLALPLTRARNELGNAFPAFNPSLDWAGTRAPMGF